MWYHIALGQNFLICYSVSNCNEQQNRMKWTFIFRDNLAKPIFLVLENILPSVLPPRWNHSSKLMDMILIITILVPHLLVIIVFESRWRKGEFAVSYLFPSDQIIYDTLFVVDYYHFLKCMFLRIVSFTIIFVEDIYIYSIGCYL